MSAVLQMPMTPAIDPAKVIDAYGVIRHIDVARVTDVRNRSAAIVWPRHELSYLLHELAGLSQSDIGFHTGKRDASSVHGSLKRINQRRTEDPGYRRSLEALVAQINAHCTALSSEAPQGSTLACRLLSDPDHAPADTEALAVNVLSALAILGSADLTDAEARRAALHMLGRDGGRING